MAKQLFIIRHAKSDWDDPKLSDHDRPLNKRGHKNAPEMARRLVKKHLIPEKLVSSTALRALTTARYFADELDIKQKAIEQEPEIYEASASTLLNIVNGFDDKSDRVAIFGHNPGFTTLLLNLCGGDIYNMPTCSVAIVDFPFNSWKLISNGTGELRFFDYPKSQD